MSLIEMQIAVEDNRSMLERAGLRGIDLDHLLDPRIEHKPCLANFNKMVAGPLSRWLEVRSACTDEQWANLEVLDENHPKMVALRRASRDLKNFFKGHVLTFYKDMERKANEERDAARAAKAAKAEGTPSA